MPESPFQRAQNEGLNQPEGRPGSRSSRRLKKQNVKERYSKLREEAQLLGLIPTVPGGAVRDEVAKTIPPPQPELVEQAIKRGWAVDEEMKPHLVQEMIDIVQSTEADTKHKIAAFRALQAGDKDQFERDNPTDKKESRPAEINIQILSVEGNQPAPVNLIPSQEGGGVMVEVVPSGGDQ